MGIFFPIPALYRGVRQPAHQASLRVQTVIPLPRVLHDANPCGALVETPCHVVQSKVHWSVYHDLIAINAQQIIGGGIEADTEVAPP